MEEGKSVNKNLYKIELLLIKFTPIIVSIFNIIDLILLYFKIQTPIFKYLGGLSFCTIIFLYTSSYVFRFCNYHRMFIHYLGISWLFGVFNQYHKITDNYKDFCITQFIIAGISLFIVLYLYVKNNKRPIIKKD